jgi:hypothetical protein
MVKICTNRYFSGLRNPGNPDFDPLENDFGSIKIVIYRLGRILGGAARRVSNGHPHGSRY